MDPDILFVIGLVAFYVLQQLAARRRKSQTGAPVPGQADSATAEDPAFDDALGEIRRALGMEPDVPAPEPPRTVEEDFHRVETGRPDYEREFDRRPRTAVGQEDAFERSGSKRTVHDDVFESAAPYSAMPPIAEDRFERSNREFRDPLLGHSHIDPIKVKLEEPVASVAPRRSRSGRLRTRSQLREAFVLKEIVGLPRALKKKIR